MARELKLLSIVAPVYNEEKNIQEFYKRVSAVFQGASYAVEIVFVNDGSSDSTPELLKNIRVQDSRVKALTFSRNFGHQIAVKAGIDHAAGDAVVIIDADLQDPPEAIEVLVEKWREGYDVVYVVRAKREGETLFKKWTAALYYRFMRSIASVSIPVDTGDFRLISGEVAEVVRCIREQSPYLRGLISWAGFRQIGVPVHRQPRFAGKTKYSLKKMLGLAWSGITHFSFFPLQIANFSGVLSLVAAAAVWIRVLWSHCLAGEALSAPLLVTGLILFLAGVQLLCIGMLGLYLARNYDQSRGRPLYILKKNND